MKTLLSFLMTISCAALVSAQGDSRLYKGDFVFPTGLASNGKSYTPVCYRYAMNGAATSGEVNEPLAMNEIFRVCLVRDKRVTRDMVTGAYLPDVTNRTAPAVAVDAAGQLVCAACGTANFAQHLSLKDGSECAGSAVDAKWMTLVWTPASENGEPTTSVVSEFAKVGEELGAPSNKIADIRSDDGSSIRSTQYGFSVYTTTDLANASDGSTSYVYMYLVAMDTRTGEGVCEGLPKHVKSYAMALCPGSKLTSQQYVNPTDLNRFWAVGATVGSSILVYWPGTLVAWQPAAEITSLAVTQDGVEKVLTGDDLKKYLTPEVTAFAQTIVEGKPSLTLTANAPDVQYYTLYTKKTLSDATWEKFEEYAKTLDNVDGKYYTRFRIDGESLSIPVDPDDEARFYQLRSE